MRFRESDLSFSRTQENELSFSASLILSLICLLILSLEKSSISKMERQQDDIKKDPIVLWAIRNSKLTTNCLYDFIKPDVNSGA